MKYLFIIIILSLILLLLSKTLFTFFDIVKVKIKSSSLENLLPSKSKFAFFSLLLVIWWLKVSSDYEENKKLWEELVKTKTLTTAKIERAEYYYRSRTIITYKYTANGKWFEDDIVTEQVHWRIDNEIRDKKFPLMFSKTNPSNNRLLFSKISFEAFNLPFPDSLKWIYNYGYENKSKVLIKKEDVPFW